MNHEQVLKDNIKRYQKAQENAAELLADALVDTYKALTGKDASDKLREALWEAVRFE